MIGNTISHYKILEKLGEGGMGIVYKALDTKLDRTVALKFLPSHLGIDQEEKKRFLHEAKAAAVLDHQNICSIYEINETEEGQMFIAMGYYEGKTLKDIIASGPLPLAEAIDTVIQVAEGLDKAHKKNIVHRDIKSANIIITDERVVKILDFGLAKLKGMTKLTRDGTTLGTVAYMSPEQAAGEKVDQRSDIWSLGVVLYEMLVGQLPFKGEYEQSIMYAVMNEEPEPVTALRSGIPPELERIIKKAMSKNSQYRYQHVDEFLSDLRYLREESDKGIKPVPIKGNFNRKKVAVFSGIFLIIAALMVILGIWMKRNGSEPKPDRKKLVVLPFENLGQPDDEYFTAGIHDEITTRLAMVRNLGVISRDSAMTYASTDKTIKEIGRELGVDYILKGTVRWAQSSTGPGKVRISPHLINVADDTSIWAETYDRVIEDIFQLQSDIARNVVDELNITLEDTERQAVGISYTKNIEAYHVFLKAEYLINQPHFNQNLWPEVIDNYQKAVNLDPEFALAWAELARAHARLVFFHLDLSPERREKAHRAAERAMELDPKSPKVHLALSYYYLFISRDSQKALEELEIADKGLPNNSSILSARAAVYELQGRFQDMIQVLKQANELNPQSASILIDMAFVYWFCREYSQAIKVSNQAGVLSPESAWPHLYKVVCYWSWMGAVNEARMAIENTPPTHEWMPYVRLWQEVGEGKFQQAMNRLSEWNGDWIDIKISKMPKSLAKAYLYEFLGESRKARQSYLESKKILENEIKKFPDDPRSRGSLGIVLASLGEEERAINEGIQATRLLPVSRDAVYALLGIHELALIYTILGEYDSALDKIEYLFSIPGYLSPGWLSLDPRWDRLKNLPRYKNIIWEYRKKHRY